MEALTECNRKALRALRATSCVVWFHGVAGQRQAHQDGAGAQDRREELPVDRSAIAARIAGSEFIPPTPIRELRDLTRQRRQLVRERSSVVNRIHKVLEDANIKLASVATDVMGKSGWDMIEAIIDGERDPHKLASLARGRLKAKRELLEQALLGRITDHHTFLLAEHRRHIRFLDQTIADYDTRIDQQVHPFRSRAASRHHSRHQRGRRKRDHR